MAEFCTVADVEDFLQLEISTEAQIASAERAIGEASAAIQNHCHQVIEFITNDTITRDMMTAGRTTLFLPELPVVSVAEVVENDEVLVVDDDYKLGEYGILHRIGAFWYVGVQAIEVTNTHGLPEPYPEDLVGVCARAASRAYQAGLKASETGAVPGLASLSLGDYAVSYAEGAGAEGVLGASGSRMLLMSEKDILDKYRYVAQ